MPKLVCFIVLHLAVANSRQSDFPGLHSAVVGGDDKTPLAKLLH